MATYGKAYYIAHREEKLARAKAHRTVFAAADRLRKYGLTATAFEDLLTSQGGVCAVCGTTDWGPRAPAVDHNHLTGIVRGILCTNCNLAMGHLRDSQKIAQAMADYLKKYSPAGQDAMAAVVLARLKGER